MTAHRKTGRGGETCTEQIRVRLPPRAKRLIVAAADRAASSLTDYVLCAALVAAAEELGLDPVDTLREIGQ